jgi:hypothetical protein
MRFHPKGLLVLAAFVAILWLAVDYRAVVLGVVAWLVIEGAAAAGLFSRHRHPEPGTPRLR